MKANEYFKKIGIDAVKEYLAVDGWRNTPFIIQLKRLVESWELVGSHKTTQYSALDNAKQHVLTLAHMEEFEKMYALEKAIADVESCQ